MTNKQKNLYNKTKWDFKNISNYFDEHISKSFIRYNDLQNEIGKLSQWFINTNSIIYNFGCSTCETEIHLLKNNSCKMEINAIDNNKSMLDVGKKKLNKYMRKNVKINFINKNVEKVNIKKNSLSISVLLTPFLNISQRKQFFKNVYKNLLINGAFILVEKNFSPSGKIENIFAQIIDEYKSQSLSFKSIYIKKKLLRGVMNSYYEKDTIEYLKSIGFQDTQVFFNHFSFTGYLCIK
tara:strand:+ start:705 stop:1415 length:711 start_codon:yes stop_codon:yes gene_type:complete